MCCASEIVWRMANTSQAPKRELPIFNKSKVNFVPNSPITHLCVSSNKIVIAMLNKTILKIDPKDPEHPEGIFRINL